MLALTKRFGLRLIAAISFIALTSLAAHAATINVPADQPTIQAAIDAASNGDTIIVAPGTYYENINFEGKAITVTSSGGPSVTTINGGGVGAVVTFDTNEGSNSVLSGFTITNGLGGTDSTGAGGGGIQIYSASPTITGNVITNNGAGYGQGAGISAWYSSALIKGNEITNNHGDGRQGGGVYIGQSSSVQLIGNHISSNIAYFGAGVAVLSFATPTIENNTITGNTAKSGGIGTAGGGGIFIYGYATVIQNLIAGNSADQGGGIYIEGNAPPQLVNNTIANNDSADGSGVYDYEDPSSSSQLFNNLIIAGNGQTALYCDGSDGGIQDGLAPTVQSSDAYSPGGIAYGGNCAGMAGTNGNVSADPLFLDATSNFHLQFGSPAIDAGDNNAPNLPSTDLAGNPRIANGTVDMGVYEFTPTTLSFTPGSIDFGSQEVGTTSSPQTVTVTNTGSQSLLLGVGVDANFSETNTCASAIAPGANCTISVSFAPTVGGSITGSLTLRDNASGSPQTVALSGTGIAPIASLSPTSLTFAAQDVGTTSAAQVVTLTNSGSVSLAISSIATTGDFAETDNCGTSLGTGASCSVNVTFTPTASGTRTGSLTIADNASGSPQTVTLSGTGNAPAASFAPTSLTFAAQDVGTTSTAQAVTLTNGGNVALSISAIAATGDFAQTNNCGTSLAAGANCSVSVTFTPTASGTRTGSLTFTDNASGSPQTVALSGTGNAPAASFAPTSLTFAAQEVGTTSSAQAVTLTNGGNVALSISGVTASGDFAETNNCGTSLAAGANCSISVTFTPTAAGTRTGSLSVSDNASGSPQTVSLSGTGTAPVAGLAPASLTFGDQVVGTTSAAQNATLSNTGNAPLTISGITVTGAFAQTNNCGTTLAAGASCSVSVTFTPSSAGALTGTLTVSSNSAGGPVSASLAGNGVEYAPTFNPTSLAFSNQVVGTKSGGKNVKLTANGPGPLVISSISVSGPFLESNNCSAPLNKGQSCNISINFLPTVGGPASGMIVVNDNGLGSPQTVPLSGNGLDFALSVTPSSATVTAGQKVQYTVTATAIGGSFNNKVNLSCSGLPSASKCQFQPGGISPKTGSASSTLTIQTSSGTPSGNYMVTITGTSGHLVHSIAVTLIVN